MRASNTKDSFFTHVTHCVVRVIILLFALPAHAKAIVPCSGLNCTFSDFFQLFVNIYNFLLGLAAVVAVLLIIFSGVRMLLYYWSEQPEPELEAAKNTLRRAIFGLVIIVTAYLVVNTLLAVLGAGDITTFFGDIGG